MSDWTYTLFHSDLGSANGPELTVFVLLLAFVIGHVIGWVYMWTHRVLSYSNTYVASLVVVPVIVSLMIMLMSGNMFVAFGLLAVFAVVRFRNVLKDTRDTAFILWAIMEGLAVGTQRFSTAIIGMVGVGFVFGYLRLTAFGSRHRYDAILSLRLAGDLVTGVKTLNEILDQHCSRIHLASERRLTEEGVDLSYRLLLRNPTRNSELHWALRQTEGLENVSLFMREDESEI
ncbi:MAG: hypothetical protein ACI9G1_005797 [Pirellulaceae bacterium]|jgi:hypothetical protein